MTQALPEKSEYCEGVYTYICSRLASPAGHYGQRSLFFRYYEQLISKTLYAASAFILLASSIVSLVYFSESKSLNNESQITHNQENIVRRDYEKQFSHLNKALPIAQAMKSSVLFSQKIMKEKSNTPQRFMNEFSQILARHDTQDLSITKINWQQFQNEQILVTSGVARGVVPSRNKGIDYAKDAKINQLATIKGYTRVSNSSLKASVNKINALIAAIEHDMATLQVKINHMPIDIRSESIIENESGNTQAKNSKIDKSKGVFEFELLIKSQFK